MKKQKSQITKKALVLTLLFSSIFLLSQTLATPTGASAINITANETQALTSGAEINISGGIISKINLTASVQNPNWKAFVGWIDGKFTLDDSTGSTIYDWSFAATQGEVYATRSSGVANWDTITCADSAEIEAEDVDLSHTGQDNISSTFTANGNAETFYVGSTSIGAGTCYSINTYDDSGSSGSDFEEVILHDGTDIIFATILEEDEPGFDGDAYDFQMIVPEVASAGWQGSTAYYLYVELGG